MLTWDEEVKPSSQNQLDGALQNERLAGQPPLAFQPAPSTVPSAAAAPTAAAAHRRVNAADKRIINGQTDVNQLVPFKYK